MANITITIPDESIPRFIEALCASNNLPINGANARKVVIQYVKDVTKGYEEQLMRKSYELSRQEEEAILTQNVSTTLEEIETVAIV